MAIYVAYLTEDSSGATPGVRVVEPAPKSPQAQRGNFYALVDLRGNGDPEPLSERLLSALQRTYYNAKGTQSQVLREAVTQAHQILLAENSRGQGTWSAGIVCVGLLSDRLAMAGLGDAFVFVTTDGGSVSIYPPDRLEADSAAGCGLLDLWPIHRQKLDRTGAVVVGGVRWLDLVSPRTLAGAAAYVDGPSIQDAADGLCEQAGEGGLTGFLLVIDDSGPPPSSRPPGGEQRPPQARAGGLPTALGATPPVTGAPPAHPPATRGGPAPRSEAAVLGAASYDLLADDPALAGEPSPALDPTAGSLDDAADDPASSDPGAKAAAAAALAGMSATVAAGAKVGVVKARDLFASMLPERTREPGEPMPEEPAEAVLASAVPAALPLPVVSQPAQPRPEPYVAPPRATGGRARVFIAAAVLILVLVPAVVGAMYWRQGASSRAQAQSLLDLAQTRLLSAQDALDKNDKDSARLHLTEARNFVVQGEDVMGRTAQSSDLMAQINREMQTVLQVKPLYGLTQPLTTFPTGADPQRVLVVDQDVYVMDKGRGQIMRYRLDPTGESLTESKEQVVLREGAQVGGVTVGPFVDLTWQRPIPGFEDKSNLLVLDANGRIFRYNQQVDGASLMDFGPNPGWKKATQIEVYSDKLYVLDEGANQIYRYAPGTYTSAPESWFPADTKVNLKNVREMRIDGDIWLLFDNGKIVRYHAGEQLPYSLDSSVALPADPADLFLGQQGDGTIFVADGADERVLVFSKDEGTFQGQLQAPEGHPLKGLHSVFIDETRGKLFLLTNSALYQQRLPL